MASDKNNKPGKGRYVWRRRYRRQKSSIFFLPAKYTAIIMLLTAAAITMVPYLGAMAWIIPFLFLLLERDSRFLGFVSAQAGLWTFARSFIVLLMDLIEGFLEHRAFRSRSESAIISALTDTRWSNISAGVNVIYYLIMILFLVMAWYYYAARIPGLAALADKAVNRLFPTKKD